MKLLLVLVGLVSAFATAQMVSCNAHAECPAGSYCDRWNACYPCEECPKFDDAIDSTCPVCVAPPCSDHNGCTGNTYCSNASVCAPCDVCTEQGDGMGGVCPDWCSMLETTEAPVASTEAEGSTPSTPTIDAGADGSRVERFRFSFEDDFASVVLDPVHFKANLESQLRVLGQDAALRIVSVSGTSDVTVLFEATRNAGARLQSLIAAENLDFIYVHSSVGRVVMQELPTSFQALGPPSTSSGSSSNAATVGALAGIFGIVLIIAIVVGVYIFKRRSAPAPRSRNISPGSRPTHALLIGGHSTETLVDDVLPDHLPEDEQAKPRGNPFMKIKASLPRDTLRGEASLEAEEDADNLSDC